MVSFPQSGVRIAKLRKLPLPHSNARWRSATGADGLRVSVSSAAGGPAAVVGTAAVATALAGTLDGVLTIGTSNCSNNGHVWTLAKRW